MKHYKDDCHHYKVIDKHRAISVLNLGEFESSICYNAYSNTDHNVIEYIKTGKVKPCTEKEYQTAFDKALNTIKNQKL